MNEKFLASLTVTSKFTLEVILILIAITMFVIIYWINSSRFLYPGIIEQIKRVSIHECVSITGRRPRLSNPILFVLNHC